MTTCVPVLRIIAPALAASVVLTACSRLGNVPINGRIKEWAATSAPADHAEILSRWEAFNYARTGAAFAAFALLIFLALRPRGSGLDSQQTAPAAANRVRRRAARGG